MKLKSLLSILGIELLKAIIERLKSGKNHHKKEKKRNQKSSVNIEQRFESGTISQGRGEHKHHNGKGPEDGPNPSP